MRKIVITVVFIAIVFNCSCASEKNFSCYYFICSGKFYNTESAKNLSNQAKVRGGVGYIYHKKANFVFVSMHKNKDFAQKIVENMPNNHYVYSIVFPKIKNKYLENVFFVLKDFFDKDLYVVETNFNLYLQNLKAKLTFEDYPLNFTALKASFFVLQSQIDKVLSAQNSQNLVVPEQIESLQYYARYFQMEVFFAIYNFALQI